MHRQQKSNRKPAVLQAVRLLLLLIVAGCSSACPNSPPSPSDQMSDSAAARPSRSTSGRIEVTAPARGQRIPENVTISGRARVPGNRVHFRLRMGKNTVLATGSADAHPAQEGAFGSFAGTLTWHGQPAGTPAELEVFAVRATDGAPDHVVTIPVVLGTSTNPVSPAP